MFLDYSHLSVVRLLTTEKLRKYNTVPSALSPDFTLLHVIINISSFVKFDPRLPFKGKTTDIFLSAHSKNLCTDLHTNAHLTIIYAIRLILKPNVIIISTLGIGYISKDGIDNSACGLSERLPCNTLSKTLQNTYSIHKSTFMKIFTDVSIEFNSTIMVGINSISYS